MAQNEKDEGDNKLSAEREQPNDETKQGNGTVDFRTRYAARLPDHLHDCHDCGAKPGEIHQDGCDTEVCSVCGLQRLQCLWIGSCRGHDKAFARWTGLWPGIAEAFVLGMDLNEFMESGAYQFFFIKPGSGDDDDRRTE